MSFLAAATTVIWGLALFFGLRVFARGSWLVRLRRLLVTIGCAALGMLCATLLVVGRAFGAFVGETLVATVTTQRAAPNEFLLTYRPAQQPGAAGARTVSLLGDQWMISGGIVKWHPWLTALGLPSYHKPLRLSGQFSRADQHRSRPPSVEVLEPRVDRLWEWFYRADPYLPFVEAVYGSAAYVYVEPDWVQDVYVTPSGYLIKRAGKALRLPSARL